MSEQRAPTAIWCAGSEEHLNRLVKDGGKEQIPCLFIDGQPLYESQDIVKWLRKNPQQ